MRLAPPLLVLCLPGEPCPGANTASRVLELASDFPETKHVGRCTEQPVPGEMARASWGRRLGTGEGAAESQKPWGPMEGPSSAPPQTRDVGELGASWACLPSAHRRQRARTECSPEGPGQPAPPQPAIPGPRHLPGLAECLPLKKTRVGPGTGPRDKCRCQPGFHPGGWKREPLLSGHRPLRETWCLEGAWP